MISALKKEQISENGTKSPVAIQRRVTYEKISNFEIHQYFIELRVAGMILNEKYVEDVWVFQDYFKDIRHTFNFKKLNQTDQIKSFLVLFMKKNQPQTSCSVGNFLIKVLEETKGLTTESINLDKVGRITPYLSVVFSDYLDFVEADPISTRIYIEKIDEEAGKYEVKTRKLPNYQSIMAFDAIVKKFIREDLSENPKYYPIVLWWKLTMVIPMRPIEFFQLKDGDFYKTKDGCYIHISRSYKSDPDDKLEHSIALVTDYKIDEELYELFAKYIDTQQIGEEGYIFNATGLIIYNDREFMGRSVLNRLQKSFYLEIVANQYGYMILEKEEQEFLQNKEIEFINYGDTRHLAFQNLIISGYNPYTIAQLGGHRSLQTQMSYYSGAVSYCTSKAFSLASGIIELDSLNSLAMTEWKQNQLIKETTDLSKARRYGNGYCISENFPYECCSSDCTSGECPYYIAEDKNNIAEAISRAKDEIKHKVELLKSILYKEPKDSVVREESCQFIQEKIFELARLYKNETVLEETQWKKKE